MTENQFLEPGEREEPPAAGPPEKLEFEHKAYGWLKHAHQEIDELVRLTREDYFDVDDVRAKLSHLDDTFEQALRDLELHVPEDVRQEVHERAAARREAMTEHPLPPFPEHPSS
jgi:hypothetical protein